MFLKFHWNKFTTIIIAKIESSHIVWANIETLIKLFLRNYINCIDKFKSIMRVSTGVSNFLNIPLFNYTTAFNNHLSVDNCQILNQLFCLVLPVRRINNRHKFSSFHKASYIYILLDNRSNNLFQHKFDVVWTIWILWYNKRNIVYSHTCKHWKIALAVTPPKRNTFLVVWYVEQTFLHKLAAYDNMLHINQDYLIQW